MYVSLIVVLGHLYLALIYPATRHALRGMTLGTVDREWALAHHRKWMLQNEETTGPRDGRSGELARSRQR